MARIKNINQNWNDQMGGNYSGFGNTNQGIASVNVPQDQQKYFSDSSQMVYPGSEYAPHRDFGEMQFSQQVQQPKKENFLNKAFSTLQGFTPTGMLMKQFTEKPQHTFNKEYFAGAEQPGIYDGRIGGLGGGAHNVFGGKNAVYGFGPELDVGAQKRISGLQNTIDKMMEGDSWTQLKENEPLKWDAKLKRLQNKHRLFTQQLAQYNKGVAEDRKARIAAERAKTAQADRAAGAFRRDIQLDPGGGGGPGKQPGTWHQQTAAKERQGVQVAGPGFGSGAFFKKDGGRIGYRFGEEVGRETDFLEGPQDDLMASGTGMESPEDLYLKAIQEGTFDGTFEEFLEELERLTNKFRAADGGRAGFENGELVTDESMMEATPAGFMQENVEEVQGEPTREELEALAMEIFQLPLEELDEQQLMIVYKAAMQQEPVQENFQEEDVQYAAGGGRIGFRYGGLVSLL